MDYVQNLGGKNSLLEIEFLGTLQQLMGLIKSSCDSIMFFLSDLNISIPSFCRALPAGAEGREGVLDCILGQTLVGLWGHWISLLHSMAAVTSQCQRIPGKPEQSGQGVCGAGWGGLP